MASLFSPTTTLPPVRSFFHQKPNLNSTKTFLSPQDSCARISGCVKCDFNVSSWSGSGRYSTIGDGAVKFCGDALVANLHKRKKTIMSTTVSAHHHLMPKSAAAVALAPSPLPSSLSICHHNNICSCQRQRGQGRETKKLFLSQYYQDGGCRQTSMVAAVAGGGIPLQPLDLTEDNIRQVLADARVEFAHVFDVEAGMTGEVGLADLDGPFVKISLKGRFWHQRSVILARVGNYLKQRIPEILEVEIEDEKQLDDSPENF